MISIYGCSTRWVVSNGQFHAQGEIGQNRHRTERTLSDFRRPADQITLPEIAIFGGGKLFAMQNTSHLGGWCRTGSFTRKAKSAKTGTAQNGR